MLLLFAGIEYYPQGGWGDFKCIIETINDVSRILAKEIEKEKGSRTLWWHVVDTNTQKIIAEGEESIPNA